MVSEKDMIAVNENNNERLYENESRLNRKNKEEIKMDMPDEDKDIDEKKALIDSRSSSPNNYINTWSLKRCRDVGEKGCTLAKKNVWLENTAAMF